MSQKSGDFEASQNPQRNRYCVGGLQWAIFWGTFPKFLPFGDLNDPMEPYMQWRHDFLMGPPFRTCRHSARVGDRGRGPTSNAAFLSGWIWHK